jgi:hypothetical protein
VDPDGDLVEFGPPERRRPWPARFRRRPPRRSRRLVGLLLLAVAAVVVVVAVAGHGGKHRAGPPAVVTLTQVGPRLLGIRAGWELFGRGPDGVVSVQFAAGRITRTRVPPVASTGAVSFVVGRDEAIIRPFDFVPGYVVPDGQRPRALPGLLNQGGAVAPGPDLEHVWVVTSGDRPSLSLVGLDGRPTGVAIPLAANGPPPFTATPDGTGSVLLTGNDGVYDARPSGLRRVSGELTAAGPGRWLAVTCSRSGDCANVLIDAASGTQRILPGPPVRSAAWPPGVISPDGSAAAVLITGSGAPRLYLINLRSGVSRAVAVQVDQEFPNGILAWSPDSRWLFIVDADGKLLALNGSTQHVVSFGRSLPSLSQIAIRA